MDQLSHVVVIYNPKSTGPGKNKAEALSRELNRKGIALPVELVATEYAGHATELAYQAALAHVRPLIVSSSGDGGYNEVINGALRAQGEGAKPVCAVLPAGNANDHRRTIGRRPLSEAVEQQVIEHIDVLKATIAGKSGEMQRYAHSYIGLGLTPAIAVELNRASLNRVKEAFIVIKSFRAFHPVEIKVDGERRVLDSMVFANISQMAKVLTIAENARPDDGEFEIVSIPHESKMHLLYQLLKAALTGWRGVSATFYKFTAVSDMVLQFDGEIVTVSAGDEVSVAVDSGALATLR